jgi:hypothetical protein
MTEAELLVHVTGMADDLGLLWFHDNDSRKDKPGFPDLVLAGMQATAFAELKDEYGTLDSAQVAWKWRLLAGGQRWYLFRPSDLESGRILGELESIR